MDESCADWRGEVQPTLRWTAAPKSLHGGAFREVRFESAESHILTPIVVGACPILLHRPEGRIQASHVSDDRHQELLLAHRRTIDPIEPAPLIRDQGQLPRSGFWSASLSPARHRWPELGPFGTIPNAHHQRPGGAPNFSVRGESISGFQTHPAIRQPLLACSLARALSAADQHASGGHISPSISTRQKIYITNGFGTPIPGIITRRDRARVARIMDRIASTSADRPCAGHHPHGAGGRR